MGLFRFASLRRYLWAYVSVSLVFAMDNKIKLSQALLPIFCKQLKITLLSRQLVLNIV
jgi:hypothetical protein